MDRVHPVNDLRLVDDHLLIAHFVGDHREDTLATRLGWAMTRLTQEGEYDQVTHCENILGLHGDGTVDIGSASIRDGGRVRIKEGVALTPGNWLITLHPYWSRTRSRAWYSEAIAKGMRYDYRGAWATVLPGRQDDRRAYCNESSALSVGFKSAGILRPCEWTAVCMSHPVGFDYTLQFHAERGIDLRAVAPKSPAALLALPT